MSPRARSPPLYWHFEFGRSPWGLVPISAAVSGGATPRENARNERRNKINAELANYPAPRRWRGSFPQVLIHLWLNCRLNNQEDGEVGKSPSERDSGWAGWRMLPDREWLRAFYGQSPAIPEGKSWVISGDHCAYCWKINLFPAAEAQMRFLCWCEFMEVSQCGITKED